ncbi:MAG: nucleotidyl transferase AbiEii/AbiGii toxin family protein [Bacteroidales bacterium]|nr:nucleotidyl transferase AbiEii/AbiGii toxin family protein [Bacteroidales bacterium]
MNISASIRARLNNIARKEKIAFQVIILRFLHERFLYRLSMSKYAENFFLKGGNFIYALQGLATRPTMDIDLLAKSMNNEAANLESIFREIATIKVEDGTWFDNDSLQVQTISQQNVYTGVRLFIMAGFDAVKQKLQVDIGFGDTITPRAMHLEYPVLLDDLPTPKLRAYTPETAIAEKFHAMIFLAGVNSRMKDFYDVYHLLISEDCKLSTLEAAIKATFKQRNTGYTENHALFTNEFAQNAIRVRQWKAFLKKINQPEAVDFAGVIKALTSPLQPIWQALSEEKS